MSTWAHEPFNTAIIDVEYTVGRKGRRRMLQLAIANAIGEWIVPTTNINHCKSAEDLELEIDDLATGNYQSARIIRKIYDVQDDTILPWRTLQEISNMIEKYIKRYGPLKTVHFWSVSFLDFEALRDLLQLSEKHDLIPPRPRMTAQPLSWWRLAQQELVLKGKLSLKLGELHKLLFPESSLHRRWHQAGADVLMTIDLINFYFRKVRGQPQRGKIENYLLTQCEDPHPDDLAEEASAQGAQRHGSEEEEWSDVESDWDSYDDDEGNSDHDDWNSESDNDEYDSESSVDGDSN